MAPDNGVQTDKWLRSDVPHSGWHVVDMLDMGEAYAVCEMCGKHHVRYVHRMSHPVGGVLSVGAVCAGRMEGDAEGAQRREKRLQVWLDRRFQWQNIKWYPSRPKKNPTINHRGVRVVIYPNAGGAGYCLAVGKASKAKKKPPLNPLNHVYLTLEDAQMGAFDHLYPKPGTVRSSGDSRAELFPLSDDWYHSLEVSQDDAPATAPAVTKGDSMADEETDEAQTAASQLLAELVPVGDSYAEVKAALKADIEKALSEVQAVEGSAAAVLVASEVAPAAAAVVAPVPAIAPLDEEKAIADYLSKRQAERTVNGEDKSELMFARNIQLFRDSFGRPLVDAKESDVRVWAQDFCAKALTAKDGTARKGIKKDTMWEYLHDFIRFYDYLCDLGHLASNPMSDLSDWERMPGVSGEERLPDEEDVLKLFDAARDEDKVTWARNRVILLLIALLKLRTTDIAVFAMGNLRVKRANGQTEYGLYVPRLKSITPLAPDVLHQLRGYLQLLDKAKAGVIADPALPMFGSFSGSGSEVTWSAMGRNRVADMLRAAARAGKLAPGVTASTLSKSVEQIGPRDGLLTRILAQRSPVVTRPAAVTPAAPVAAVAGAASKKFEVYSPPNEHRMRQKACVTRTDKGWEWGSLVPTEDVRQLVEQRLNDNDKSGPVKHLDGWHIEAIKET